MENLKGILFMLLSMAGFAVEDALIKVLSTTLPISQILVVLGMAGALLFAVLAFFWGEKLYSEDIKTKPFMIRLGADMLAPLFFLPALALLPLATLTSILQAAPIMVTLGAALFLGQSVGWRRWSAIFAGFIGMLIIVRPGMEGFDAAALLALLGVTFLSIRDLATRVIRTELSTLTVTAYSFAVMAIAGCILIPFFDPFLWPTPREWALFALSTCIGGIAYAAIVKATRAGDVAVIAPFRYSRLVFALFIAVFFLGERPDWQTLLGASIIIASGLYTFWREQVAAHR